MQRGQCHRESRRKGGHESKPPSRHVAVRKLGPRRRAKQFFRLLEADRKGAMPPGQTAIGPKGKEGKLRQHAGIAAGPAVN